MTISMRLTARHDLAAIGLAALLTAISGQAANAQSTWDGGGADNNWGTANNWNNNQVPSFPADLVFDGGTRLAPNNDLANPVVRNIGFGAGAGPFVIGGNAFTLGDDATGDYRDGGIDQLDDSLQTINNNITLARGQRDIATAAGAGGLTLNGTISRNPGSAVRFVPLGGPIKTTLTNTNGLLGGWATIENPNPAFVQETFLFAKIDASGNIVPYVGSDYSAENNIDGFAAIPETTFPAGMNASSNIRWFGSGTAGSELTVAAPGISNLNTFLFEQDAQQTVNIGAGNTLRFSNGGGIFRSAAAGAQGVESLRFTDGTITAGNSSAPATLYIWKNTTINDPAVPPNGEEANFTIHLNSTNITDNPDGGPVTVVSSGSGGVRTSAAGHSFTGGLYINRGVWRAQANMSTAFGAGPVYVASGAQAYVNADGAVPNDFYLNGLGINEGAFFVGAIRIAADGAVMNGNIILTANTRIGNRGAQASAAELGDPVAQGVLFNGKITGNYNLELSVKNDQGGTTLDANMPTMILANATNDWTGSTTIGNGRIRVGGTGEVIPHGPGKGNVTLLGEGTATARPTVLTVDGLTETVNGLSSSGAESEVFVTNQAATDGTIRMGANNATSTFGGSFADTVGFGKLHVTKIGSGTFTSTGLNAYTGDTRVYGGVMSITNATLDDLADVHVTPGAVFDLNFAGTDTIDSLFFGGVAQASGTWGALASSATNKSARFTGTGILQVSSLSTSLIPGDFDLDNDVDADDLAKWRTNFGDGGGADADFDGDSDGNDFLIWQGRLGQVGPAVATGGAVPEPGAVALAGLAVLGLGVLRRQRG